MNLTHQLSKQAAEPWPPSGCLYHLLRRGLLLLLTLHNPPPARCLLAPSQASLLQWPTLNCQPTRPSHRHHAILMTVTKGWLFWWTGQAGSSKHAILRYAGFPVGDAWRLLHEAVQCKHNARSGSETWSHSQLSHALAVRFWESCFHSGQNFQFIILAKMGKNCISRP